MNEEPWYHKDKKYCQRMRDLLLTHDCWYGDTTKTIVSEDNDIADVHEDDYSTVKYADIILNFHPMTKQCYVTIVCAFQTQGGCESHDVYFLTWYDNRPFEVFTKNGQEITTETYDELLSLLEKCNFQFEEKNLSKIKVTDTGFIEKIYISKLE